MEQLGRVLEQLGEPQEIELPSRWPLHFTPALQQVLHLAGVGAHTPPPHFALAHFSAYGDRAEALRLLAPFEDLMHAMAIGTLPEVADGDAPHAPRGCVAQAWTVAETLRAWHALSAEQAKPRRAAKPKSTPRRAPNRVAVS